MAERKRKVFRAWITKRALTRGIRVLEVEDCFATSPTMVHVKTDVWSETYHANQWFRTYKEALAHAEIMRTKKIKSLEKQIKKLKVAPSDDSACKLIADQLCQLLGLPNPLCQVDSIRVSLYVEECRNLSLRHSAPATSHAAEGADVKEPQ